MATLLSDPNHALNTSNLVPPNIFGQTTIDFEKTLKEATSLAIFGENLNRKVTLQRWFDYYQGNQELHLRTLLHKQFAEPENLKLHPRFRNITKKIINLISLVYKSAPKRKIINPDGEVNKKDQKLWDKIEKDTGLNALLKTVNRLTTLMRRVVVKVAWRKDAIAFDIITPDILDVIVDEDTDPITPVAMFWAANSVHQIKVLRNKEGSVTTGLNNSDVMFEWWSTEDHPEFPSKNFMFDGAGKIKGAEEDNPILVKGEAVIPVVEFAAERPVNDYFIGGGHALINAQESLNVNLTDLQYLFKMQSFSIPVVTGMDANELAKSGGLVIDPSSAILIPKSRPGEGENKFEFITPNAKLTELQEFIRESVVDIATDHNISPENFVTSAKVTTGIALKILNMNLLDAREDDIEIYRTSERQLYDIVRAVNNAFNNEKFSEDSEMLTDFAEVSFPVDEMTELTNLEKGIALDVDSNIAFLMNKNPDLSEKQAEELVEINKKRKPKTSTPVGTPFSAPPAEEFNILPEEGEEEEIEEEEIEEA